jgi:hypothetical protein
VHRLLNRGYTEVVDADLSGYFDTIPHHELMQSVARRVSDRAMLALVKSWLEMPVEEDDRKGYKQRTTVNKDSGRGTPKGAPISPLLANLYMRRFLLGWKQQGWNRKLQAHIVNYADDFVILCRNRAEEARQRMEIMMQKLRLTVNQQKTRICRVPVESFDWCVSTDPEFSRKASEIVGLYLNPPENAIVLSIDEKPSIQALKRAQGYIRLPSGRAVSGFAHGYQRHGTTTLFAALETASGLVKAGHYKRRRRREFLDFMNGVIDAYV